MNPAIARPRSAAATRPAARRPAWRQPVLLWALVMMVAMMSFYVHLINTQVQRGEGLRQAQRATVLDGKRAQTAADKRADRVIRISENTAR